jgi:hypothetical protein
MTVIALHAATVHTGPVATYAKDMWDASKAAHNGDPGAWEKLYRMKDDASIPAPVRRHADKNLCSAIFGPIRRSAAFYAALGKVEAMTPDDDPRAA